MFSPQPCTRVAVFLLLRCNLRLHWRTIPRQICFFWSPFIVRLPFGVHHVLVYGHYMHPYSLHLHSVSVTPSLIHLSVAHAQSPCFPGPLRCSFLSSSLHALGVPVTLVGSLANIPNHGSLQATSTPSITRRRRRAEFSLRRHASASLMRQGE